MVIDGRLPAQRTHLPVAVDTMGGDNGFGALVEGAVQAYKEFGERSILVGPAEDLRARLKALGAAELPFGVVDAPETIGMDEPPTRSVRRKPNSSLCVAYNLAHSGEASAVLSAGNSGAMMAAGILICGLMPGIERPAIATLIPSSGNKPPNVILDSGANVDCHAHNLVQFAIMGAIYYSSLFGFSDPKVALLSNGTESSKGTDLIRATALALSQLKGLNYVGYVEGREIAGQTANVIVCDGFVGNIVLKSMEGCVRLIADQILHEGKKGLFRKVSLGLSRGILRDVFTNRFDYSAHGGAPLLGLRRLGIVLHGSSDSRAVKNAIRVAENFVRSGMNEKIGNELAQLEENHLRPLDDIFDNVLMQKKNSKGRAAKAIIEPATEGEKQDDIEVVQSPGEE